MNRFFKSFYFACRGIEIFFKAERNGKIQAAIALCAVVAGYCFKVSQFEWVALLFCMGLVIGLEMINTTVEKVCDMHSTEYDEDIKVIKDIAAGAVLWVSILSAIVGCIIFIPHLVAYL